MEADCPPWLWLNKGDRGYGPVPVGWFPDDPGNEAFNAFVTSEME